MLLKRCGRLVERKGKTEKHIFFQLESAFPCVHVTQLYWMTSAPFENPASPRQALADEAVQVLLLVSDMPLVLEDLVASDDAHVSM